MHIYASVNYRSLVQLMACRLVGAKPLPDLILEYCWLDPEEQTSMKFQSILVHFHSRKCIWKCHLGNGSDFVMASMCEGLVGKWVPVIYVLCWWVALCCFIAGCCLGAAASGSMPYAAPLDELPWWVMWSGHMTCQPVLEGISVTH